MKQVEKNSRFEQTSSCLLDAMLPLAVFRYSTHGSPQCNTFVPTDIHNVHVTSMYDTTSYDLKHYCFTVLGTRIHSLNGSVSRLHCIKLARQRNGLSSGSNHKASTSLQTGGPSSSGPQSPLSEDASRGGVQRQSFHPLPPCQNTWEIAFHPQ